MPLGRYIINFLLILLAASGPASPVALEGRKVLASSQPEAGNPAAVVQLDANIVELLVIIDDKVDLADSMWALHVQFVAGLSKPPSLASNGEFVMADPFRRGDGYLYRLGPGQLQHGLNHLRLTTLEDDELLLHDHTLFSLQNTFEAVHFNRAFADSTRREALTAVQPPSHPDQLRFDVQGYHLYLKPTMTSTYLEGELTMTARAVDDGLSQAVLDFHANFGQMMVTTVDSGPETEALDFTHDASENRLHIQLPSPVNSDDEFTVRVAYEGIPNEESRFGAPYRRSLLGGRTLIFTLSQPYGARTWWPCKDTPDDKALFSSTVDIPSGYTIVSNGLTQSVEETGDGLMRWHHAHQYPIATYLASLTIGYFVPETTTYTSRDGTIEMPIRNYFRLGPGGSSETVPTMKSAIEIFSDLFGEYPFINEKYEQVHITGTASMEHQTASSMAYPVTPNVTVHEIAHQWFGDKVGFAHYDHLWLSESWATYCEGLFVEATSGTAAFEAWVAEEGLAQPLGGSVPLVTDQADGFYFPVFYIKGAAILHTLRNWLGDEAFFQGARDYLTSHAYDAALTDDLKHAIEAASGEDLDQFFDVWVHGTQLPSVAWRWWRVGEPTDGIFFEARQVSSGRMYPLTLEAQVTLGGSGPPIRQPIRMENGIGRTLVSFTAGRTPSGINVSKWTAPQAVVPPIPYPQSFGFKKVDGGYQFDLQRTNVETHGNRIEYSPDGNTWIDFQPPHIFWRGESRVVIPSASQTLMARVIAPMNSGPARYSAPFMATAGSTGMNVLMVVPRTPEDSWYMQTANALEELGIGVTMVSREMPDFLDYVDPPSAIIWLQGPGPLAQNLHLPREADTITAALGLGIPMILAGSGVTEVTGMPESEVLAFQQDYLGVTNSSPVITTEPFIGSDILDGIVFTADSTTTSVATSFDPVGHAIPIAFSPSDNRPIAHRQVASTSISSDNVPIIVAAFNIDGIHDVPTQAEILRRMLLSLTGPADEIRDWIMIE